MKTIKINEEELKKIIKEETKKVLKEQIFYTDELIEYAKLIPEKTGLPVTIYVDDGGAYKRNKHSLWVFMQNDYNNKAKVIPITVSYNPQILVPENQINIPLNYVNEVLMFIKNNVKLLKDFADEKVSHLDFYDSYKKGIRLPAYVTEMSTLRSKDSGLPVTIWIDEGSSPQHDPRIKFQASNEQKITREFSSMSISPIPKVFNLPEKCGLSGRQIDEIKEFVKNNEKLLLNVANGTMNYDDFLKNMIKNK